LFTSSYSTAQDRSAEHGSYHHPCVPFATCYVMLPPSTCTNVEDGPKGSSIISFMPHGRRVDHLLQRCVSRSNAMEAQASTQIRCWMLSISIASVVQRPTATVGRLEGSGRGARGFNCQVNGTRRGDTRSETGVLHKRPLPRTEYPRRIGGVGRAGGSLGCFWERLGPWTDPSAPFGFREFP